MEYGTLKIRAIRGVTNAVLTIAFLFSGPSVLKAQNANKMEDQQNDSVEISRVLDTYFKSIYDGDAALLKTTFNPGTLLFGDVKGQPYAKTLDQYLDGVQNRKSPKDSGQPFKGEIKSVDVIHSIAIAKVRVKMYDFNYYELLSFHKINGRWLIVNKMITHVDE
jgi:Putative lumazine-binding